MCAGAHRRGHVWRAVRVAPRDTISFERDSMRLTEMGPINVWRVRCDGRNRPFVRYVVWSPMISPYVGSLMRVATVHGRLKAVSMTTESGLLRWDSRR